jgi:hypothetical protein
MPPLSSRPSPPHPTLSLFCNAPADDEDSASTSAPPSESPGRRPRERRRTQLPLMAHVSCLEPDGSPSPTPDDRARGLGGGGSGGGGRLRRMSTAVGNVLRSLSPGKKRRGVTPPMTPRTSVAGDGALGAWGCLGWGGGWGGEEGGVGVVSPRALAPGMRASRFLPCSGRPLMLALTRAPLPPPPHIQVSLRWFGSPSLPSP